MERVCFRMQVDPARLDEYIAAHRAVWPAMLEALETTGWRNYSLFTDPTGMVIGYLEFTDPTGMVIGYLETHDYGAAQQEMELTEINTAWQQSMSPFFAVGGSFEAGPERLREVFHLEDQLTAARATASTPPRTQHHSNSKEQPLS